MTAGAAGEFKAPNGAPSALVAALGEEAGRRAWYTVRTPGFIKWFGDWERAARIAELEKASNLTLDGEAYRGKCRIDGTPRENRRSIIAYLSALPRLTSPAVEGPILIGSAGRYKMTSFGMSNGVYMKSLAHIPEMLRRALLITEHKASRDKSHYPRFKHMVLGIALEGTPYTVHIVLGENAGTWYYQHNLTAIEKGSLIGVIHETDAGRRASLYAMKDTTLMDILQVECSRAVDANGEPLVVYPVAGAPAAACDESGRRGSLLTFTTGGGRAGVRGAGMTIPLAAFLNLRHPITYSAYLAMLETGRGDELRQDDTWDGCVDDITGKIPGAAALTEYAVRFPTQIWPVTGSAAHVARLGKPLS